MVGIKRKSKLVLTNGDGLIERINKNLEVIRFCINNYNKPIQEYKLK